MSEDNKNLEVQFPNSETTQSDSDSRGTTESGVPGSQPLDLNQDSVVGDGDNVGESETVTEEKNISIGDNPEQIIATLAQKVESEPDTLELVSQLQHILVSLSQNQQIMIREMDNIKLQLGTETQQSEVMKKRYIGLAAEFDNFRKRTLKEKEELEKQAKSKTLSELLAVVDNFERARTQIKPANDGELGIHKSYQGVYKTLVDSLKRLGVSAMRPEGQPFDPTYHEAMLREATDEYPEGTVIEQLVRGYLLDEDHVLRHAMVKVATAPEISESQEDSSTAAAEAQTPSS
jgi:molecular chaperone GrpE